MANEIIKVDANNKPVIAGVTDDANLDVMMIRVAPATGYIKTELATPSVVEVLLSYANDSVAIWSNTAKTGGGTDYQPIVDSDGHFQVDILSGPAGGDGAILDGATPSIEATVKDYTNDNPLCVRLTDTDGNYVGAGAGTQYADGAARGSATGTLMMGDDSTNIQSVAVDVAGHLQVDVLSGGGGGVQHDEDDGHTSGDTGTLALAIRNDANAVMTDTNLDYTGISTDSSGRIKLGAGNLAIGKLAPNDGVDIGDVDVASSVLPTGAATSANQLPDDHNVTVSNANIPVTQSGAWNITNITGTVTLPTGAATSANQLPDGHNVTVDNAVGSGVYVRPGTAATWDVSDRAGRDLGEVDVVNCALPTGAATSANQLPDGHNVTVDNVAASGVYIRPGTGVNLDTSSVTVTSAPTTAVTNAGLTELAAAINANEVDINIASDSVGIGGGTQYTEGTTQVSIVGTAILWEDTSDVVRAASAANPFPVEIITGGGSGGTAMVDDSTFTVETTQFTPTGGLVDETSPDTVAEGEAGVFRMTPYRSLWTSIMTPNGDSCMDDTNDAVQVNVVAGGAGDGAIQDGASPAIEASVKNYTNDNPLCVRLTDTNGDYIAAGGGTQYAEDTATAAAEYLTMAGVVRNDTPSTLVDADQDRTVLTVDNLNRLWVNVANFPDNEPFDVAQYGGSAVGAGNAVHVQPGTAATWDISDRAARDLGTVDVVDITGTVSLPTGAATSAGQLADGHNVIVNNAAGTGVYIRPGTGINLDTSAVTITGFPDNEPFDLAQYGGSAVGPTNPVDVAPGTGETWDVSDRAGRDLGGVDVNNAAGSGVYVRPGTAETWDISDRAARDLGQLDVQDPCGGTQTNDIAVFEQTATSGGASISRLLSAASTNSTLAKSSAGQVYGWYITNNNASERYVKLYNKASAPTIGTDTPVITLLIPGNTAGAGTNVNFSAGIAFATGIGYGTTTGYADNDTGAVAAGEIIVNLFYK
jgi:uncharacterized cupin superfamily protein